jgi:hypothetical protein
MRNEAWELAVHQARQIMRGYGQPLSQESEVMAAASVGMAGLALARTVLAAAELDAAALALARAKVETMPVVLAIPKEIQHVLDQAEWERGGALKRLYEQLSGPIPDDALPDANERARQRGLGPDA